MPVSIGRRDVIGVLGGTMTWPLAARAQQQAVPLIGFLSSRSQEESVAHTAGFLQGLKAFGYIDGQTAKIEYKWASGDYGRLPALAKELVTLHPAILAVGGASPSVRAAKAATSSIPIVCVSGDLVAEGLVASLARPGGNVTGFSIMSNELGAKRLELVVRLVSQADAVGLLTNPQIPTTAAAQTQDVGAAAKGLGLRLVVVGASTEPELETGFAALAKAGVKALVVQNDPFFDAHRDRLIALTAQWRIPAIFHIREYPADGGLISYGPSLVEAYRQMGILAGRILKGANVNDLPVMRPTQFELVINMKTARALGLTVPPVLLAEADEVIE